MSRLVDQEQSSTNVLEWWIDNEDHFPASCTKAGLTLHIHVSATSVSSSERVFSLSGNIVNARRSNLKPENVNILVFLNKMGICKHE